MKIEITLREDFTLNDWKQAKMVADDHLFEVLSNTERGDKVGAWHSERNGYACHCRSKSFGLLSTLSSPHMYRVVIHGESLKEEGE